ncbi:MAG: hypothetical protein J6Y80_04900 [Victivallales bacterium]|nr:hypothetical protein [Victivallales bacterium]
MPANPDILLLGLGTAGARAAYYIYQRGGLPGLRIIAMDSGEEVGNVPATLTCVELPPPPRIPTPTARREANEAIDNVLEENLQNTRMLFIVTCLGGATGSYYTQEALDFAKRKDVPAVALAGLPHAFDSEECKFSAETSRNSLRSQHFQILDLDCAAFGHLFPDSGKEAAYSQAVRWIAETTLGYLKLFTLPKNSERQAAEQTRHTASLANLPRGIFTNTPATFFNGENLDLPTFWRNQNTSHH